MTQAKEPCLSVADKFGRLKRDFPWIETQNTMVIPLCVLLEEPQ